MAVVCLAAWPAVCLSPARSCAVLGARRSALGAPSLSSRSRGPIRPRPATTGSRPRTASCKRSIARRARGALSVRRRRRPPWGARVVGFCSVLRPSSVVVSRCCGHAATRGIIIPHRGGRDPAASQPAARASACECVRVRASACRVRASACECVRGGPRAPQGVRKSGRRISLKCSVNVRARRADACVVYLRARVDRTIPPISLTVTWCIASVGAR